MSGRRWVRGGWALGALWLLTRCGPALLPDGADDAASPDEGAPGAPAAPSAPPEEAAQESALTTSWTGNLRVQPEADGTVDARAPERRLGRETRLVVDGAPDRRALVRFRVEGLRGRVARATLQLFAKDGSREPLRVYATRQGLFEEDTLTWRSAPIPRGPLVARVDAVPAGAWLSLDVTDAVRADGDLTFLLVADGEDGATFVSRDSGRYLERPLLRVELDVDEPCEAGAAPPQVPGESCAYRGDGTGGTTVEWFPVGGRGGEYLASLSSVGSDLLLAGEYSSRPGERASFGGPELLGQSGIALARLRSDGGHVWTRSHVTLGDEGQELLPWVDLVDAVASSTGDLTTLGRYQERPDFGTGPLRWGGKELRAMWLVQYAPDGRVRWSRGFGARRSLTDTRSSPLRPHALATDPSGNLTVVGSFEGVVDFGGGPLVGGFSRTPRTSHLADPGAYFLARFAPDGRHLWSRAMPRAQGYAHLYGHASNAPVLAVDADGSVAMGGSLMPAMDLGAGPATDVTQATPFVARYAADGRFLWQRLLRGASGGIAGVAVSGERVFFSGAYFGRFTFAGREPINDGLTYSPFVGALEAGGRDGWLRTLGYTDSSSFAPQQLQVDRAGHVVLGTYLRATWSAGGGVLRPGWLVASFQPDGTHRWSRTLSRYLGLRDLTVLDTGELVLGLVVGQRGATLEGTRYTPPTRWSDLVFLRLRP